MYINSNGIVQNPHFYINHAFKFYQFMKCSLHSICQVQASKARYTPHKFRYNAQIGPDITKVKTQKVNFLTRRIYLFKNLRSQF